MQFSKACAHLLAEGLPQSYLFPEGNAVMCEGAVIRA